MTTSKPGTLRAAYDVAMTATRQTKIDGALVAAGGAVADAIDGAMATNDHEQITKAVYLVPHLMNVLREMLATPASRVVANKTRATTPTKTLRTGADELSEQRQNVARRRSGRAS